MFPGRQYCSQRHLPPHSCFLLNLAATPLGADLVTSHLPDRTNSVEGEQSGCYSFDCVLNAVTAMGPDARLKFSHL